MHYKLYKILIFFAGIFINTTIMEPRSVFSKDNHLTNTNIHNQKEYMTKNLPKAVKKEHITQLHNFSLNDEYHWMRDKNWPKSISDDKIKSYIEEENEFAETFFAPLKKVQNDFYEELKSRIKLSDKSEYVKRNQYLYFSRTEESENYPIYCRQKNIPNAPEEIMLDINQLSKQEPLLNLGTISIDPSETLLAYSIDTKGDERYKINIKNLKTGQLIKDSIENTISSIVWHEHLKGFFYTPVDEDLKHNKVFFHKLGTDPLEDKLIFEEKDPLYYVSISRSSDKEFLFISSDGHENNEIHFLSIQGEDFTPKLLDKRSNNIYYDIDSNNGVFYIKTNKGATKNFHIKTALAKNYKADQTNWKTYIKESEQKYLSGFDISENYILLNYTNNYLPVLIVQNIKTQQSKQIKFEDAAFEAYLYSTNFEEDDIRISYSSLKSPKKIYSYNYKTENKEILKEQIIPSGFDSGNYHVERLLVDLKNENKKIPVTLLYKKSLFKNNGTNYLYLTAYGSYGISNPVSFRNVAISIADSGMVYAIAHIRGGSELGLEWYESAKFLDKKNSFKDFILVTEHLINKKYTSSKKIIISGGSAGGMLIGNVINQRPDLFYAAILHVPFVDVLNTMLDESLPLTSYEFKEWGNPKELEYFEYINSYCPYQNIQKQDYPHIYVTSGLNDIRVGYWEALKWVAKIRDFKSNDNLVLLKTKMNFGHSGASKRFEAINDAAEELSFIYAIKNLS